MTTWKDKSSQCGNTSAVARGVCGWTPKIFRIYFVHKPKHVFSLCVLHTHVQKCSKRAVWTKSARNVHNFPAGKGIIEVHKFPHLLKYKCNTHTNSRMCESQTRSIVYFLTTLLLGHSHLAHLFGMFFQYRRCYLCFLCTLSPSRCLVGIGDLPSRDISKKWWLFCGGWTHVFVMWFGLPFFGEGVSNRFGDKEEEH